MTIIIADTTCGLPRNLLKQLGIPLIPQIVEFGDTSYHDDAELDTAAFLQKLRRRRACQKRRRRNHRFIILFSRRPAHIMKA